MKNKIVMGIKNDSLVQAKLDSLAITFAPSQSGKSVTQVISNTTTCIDSVLVFDIKQDVFHNTCDYRKNDLNVFLFHPGSREAKTYWWNPHDSLDPISSCIQNPMVIE